MSKIEVGMMSVEHIKTMPAQIVKEAASLMQPRAEGKGIALVVKYDTPIPEQIESDPTRLRQILLNLIGNAVKFTEAGTVAIRVSADPDLQLLRLSVVDTGIGMNPEQCDRIARFDAFNQADGSTTRKYGGSGLGLRISNSLAQLLGGRIEVESVVGAGSTFTVTVATGDLASVRMLSPDEIIQSTGPTDQEQTKRADDTGGKPLDGLRLLLAEDGPDNQRLISYILKQAGADVLVAGNGQIAIDKVHDACIGGDLFDVILMDMQMPILDGYEATRQLRQKDYTGPIIALTAHAMAEDRQKCLAAGCDDFATKPIDRSKLIAMLKTCISSGKPVLPSQANKSDTLVSELVDDDMQELVEMFVGELPDRIDAIEKAIEEQDRASLGQLAHQLKGAAGGYGFPTISDAAELLESSAKAGKELETLRLQTLQLRELCSRSSATGVLLKS